MIMNRMHKKRMLHECINTQMDARIHIEIDERGR